MVQEHCHLPARPPTAAEERPFAEDDATTTRPHPQRPAAIRPLRPRLPYTLPPQPTPLVGREQELAVACARLRRSEVRLLTLTGPGGVGKTRLMHAIVAAIAEEFADGIVFADLTTLDAADHVAAAIVRSADDGLTDGTPVDLLRGREVLLVLDSFERAIDAAPQVGALLTALPQLTVLVTSRMPLRLRWEHELSVTPLALPDVRHLPDLTALAAIPSMALFVERAAAVCPDFVLDQTTASAVAELCVRLDGLPLALEQAAAQLKLLSVQGLLQQLLQGSGEGDGGLATGVLRARDVGGPQRHSTVDAMHLSSYDTLGLAERQALEQLAICVEGCTLGAVEAIWAVPGTARTATLERLGMLVDQSFLRREMATASEPRFRMLATLRPLLLERLRARDDFPAIQERHAAYALALAEEAARHLHAETQAMWLDRLDADRENLHAALQWCIAQGDAEWGLRLGIALWRFWWHRGHVGTGRRLLAGGLALPLADLPAGLHAAALGAAGNLAAKQGDYRQARSFLEASLARYRAAPDRDDLAIATTLDDLGLVLYRHGDHAAARACLEESLAQLARLDARQGMASARTHLALLALAEGAHTDAYEQLTAALAIFIAAGDSLNAAPTLCYLGNVALQSGQLAVAQAWFEQARSHAERVGVRRTLIVALAGMGEVAFAREAYATARAHFAESLRLARQDGDQQGIFSAIEGLASLAAASGDPARALRLAAASERLRAANEVPAMPAEAARLGSRLARPRRTYSDDVVAALHAESRTMTLHGAIESALADNNHAAHQPRVGAANGTAEVSAAAAEGLTPRERDVAGLVAQGLTNREVAEALSIAERTVGTHVAHILAKLALTSRVQIAAWVVGQRALPPSD